MRPTTCHFSITFSVHFLCLVLFFPYICAMRVVERMYCSQDVPLRIVDMKISQSNSTIGYFFECVNPPLQKTGSFMNCHFVKRSLDEDFPQELSVSPPLNVSAQDPLEFFLIDSNGTQKKERITKEQTVFHLSLLLMSLSVPLSFS